MCEYKIAAVYPIDQKAAIEAEYDENGEGSYIIDSTFPIPKEGRICFDATRKFNQIGRYLNHAQSPNAKLTRPYKIRGKWRIGFLSLRDIGVGEEVVWDYGVRGEEWSGCRLVGGVVRNPPTPTQQVGKEAKDGNAGEVPEMVTAPASPVKPQEVAIPTQQVGKEAKDGNAGEVPEMVTAPASPVKPQEVAGPSHPAKPAPKGRRSEKEQQKRSHCWCPVCKTGPHAKISNHLATQHKLSKKERKQYLFGNRLIATPQEMSRKVRKPVVLRRSQRTIESVLKAMAEGNTKDKAVEVGSDSNSDSNSSDSESPAPSSTPGGSKGPLNPPTTDAPISPSRSSSPEPH